MNEANQSKHQQGVAANDADSTDAASPVVPPVSAEYESIHEKFADAMTPGFQAEFDPAEAEAAGAFVEDALTEADALDSAHDNFHVDPDSSPQET
jgi:hypothetical protein